MKFYSTNNPNHRVSLKEAVLNGLPPDNGLYMPEHIPLLPNDFFKTINQKSFQDIAFEVAHKLMDEDLSTTTLEQIIQHTVSFDAPLVPIEKNIFALELFHGPTLAFKDFGARFMSQVLRYFAKQQNQEVIILVATSGDTGSAVANGFLGVEGIRVVVLYPSGKVSEIQEKQFTTLGQNITAVEIEGSFDDCQRMVKQAFGDDSLRKNFFLSSANSINIARLIPQSFYYFYAWSRLTKNERVVFSVPSGNFGNLTAGLIAMRMGLPLQQIVASTNVNDVVPVYLKTQQFNPRPSTTTISNAMDVGNPSNFARILDLYSNQWEKIKQHICGYSFTDAQTKNIMKQVYKEKKYTLDPHGAVAYLGLKEHFYNNTTSTGVFLETAHPAKFKEVVEDIVQNTIEIPSTIKQFLKREKQTISCSIQYEDLKEIIQSKFR